MNFLMIWSASTIVSVCTVFKQVFKMIKEFADEGYKLNIFTPLAGFSGEKVLQDIASDAGADVYFSTFVTEDQLAKDAYANTVADITELVYNQKPINFKGEDTGSKTIKQIMEEDSYGYIGYQRADGSYIYGSFLRQKPFRRDRRRCRDNASHLRQCGWRGSD